MEKKTNKGLISLVVALTIIVLGLGGYIVYDKVLNIDKNNKEANVKKCKNNEDATEEKSIEDNTVEQDTATCALYKFDSNYQLTDSDKEQIVASINKMEGMGNEKVDASTINVTKRSNYILYITFETVNKTGNYEFGGIVFKVNKTFKAYTIGSGYDSDQIKHLEYTLSRICS